MAVVAVDDHDRVLLIRHYRHPIGAALWEVPAGRMDRSGETSLDAAHRELAEDTGYAAMRWDALVELHTSPGVLTERTQVWLARELSDPPGPRDAAGYRWVPLRQAVEMVFAAEITNGLTVAGILAAAHHLGDRT